LEETPWGKKTFNFLWLGFVVGVMRDVQSKHEFEISRWSKAKRNIVVGMQNK
jgi:hypothetical protein